MISRNSYERLVLYDVARIEQYLSVQLRMMDVESWIKGSFASEGRETCPTYQNSHIDDGI